MRTIASSGHAPSFRNGRGALPTRTPMRFASSPSVRTTQPLDRRHRWEFSPSALMDDVTGTQATPLPGTRTITIPELSLVVLVGASGSGKSSFSRKHFGGFETISSDFCRGLVSNDENDQSATGPAFEVLHAI